MQRVVHSIGRNIGLVLFGGFAVLVWCFALHMDRTAPDVPLRHLSQSDAAGRCRTGAASEEEVRHEASGDYHFYRCYGSDQIVDAYE